MQGWKLISVSKRGPWYPQFPESDCIQTRLKSYFYPSWFCWIRYASHEHVSLLLYKTFLPTVRSPTIDILCTKGYSECHSRCDQEPISIYRSSFIFLVLWFLISNMVLRKAYSKKIPISIRWRPYVEAGAGKFSNTVATNADLTANVRNTQIRFGCSL